MFTFKQFTINDDRCAMKVGTDGVLLGAWAEVDGRRRLLDIGSGSGLIALMAAQRCPEASVTGVEIDEEACRQARENVAGSPFSRRVNILHQDVKNFHTDEPFDCILCNPPFFTEDTLPDDPLRARARHTSDFSFPELVTVVCRLLSVEGLFHVVLPYTSYKTFVTQSFISGLNVVRMCHVKTTPKKSPRRTLLSFSPSSSPISNSETLVLMDDAGNRCNDYTQLTKDFYL